MVNRETPFFTAGGTLRQDVPSYVERQADMDLFEGLMAGEFCYVLTSRQMGKSSLMVRTKGRLEARGVTAIVLDLTSVGQNLTPEQWYVSMLNQAGETIGLEDELETFWFEHEHLSPLLRWMAAIREVVLTARCGKVVIFIDEIDLLQSLPFSADEFLAGIRECYTRRATEPEMERLTFALFGVATPSDLIKDTRVTPFNIGRRVELSDFTVEEAASLARGLRRDERTDSALLARVLYWTSGHPYLTQQLCRTVADRAARSPSDVDQVSEEIFFAGRAKERDTNLLFVRDRLLRNELDRVGLLDLYGRVWNGERVKDDETSPLVDRLRLSGVVRSEEGRLRVRNRIYGRVFDRRWVRENMPDAEVVRQRMAYRRGALRTATVASVLLATIGSLVVTAAVQTKKARRLLYVSDMNAAQGALQRGNVSGAQTLLERHVPEAEGWVRWVSDRLGSEGDLRGFEWRYLERRCREARPRDSYEIDPAGIASFALFPDGRRIAVRSLLGRITVWDTATRQPVATVSGLGVSTLWASIGSSMLAISPGGRVIAATGPSATVRLYDEQLHPIGVLGGKTNPLSSSVVFSPDGKLLVTGSAIGTAVLWDVTRWRAIGRLPGPSLPYKFVFSPDSRELLAGEPWWVVPNRCGYLVFDVRRLQRVAAVRGHTDGLAGLAYDPQGRRVATSSFDSTVRVWNTAGWHPVGRHRAYDDWILDLTFSQDSQLLAGAGHSGAVYVWRADSGAEIARFEDHHGSVNAVRFGPDGRRLYSGSADGSVKVWDLDRKPETASLPNPGVHVYGLAYSPDGRSLAAWVAGQIRVWDTTTSRLLYLHDSPVGSAAFAWSPDSRVLAVAAGDRVDEIDGRSGKASGPSIPIGGRQGVVLTFSPDGRLLATVDTEGHLRVWDFATHRTVFEPPLHHTGTYGLAAGGETQGGYGPIAFSTDGRLLLGGNTDGTVTLWDIGSWRERRVLRGPTRAMNAAKFAPDGGLIAGADDAGLIWLWDRRSGQLRATLHGHRGMINDLVFSPDGRTIASAAEDRMVKLWNVGTGEEVATLAAGAGPAGAVAFSPDGSTLASGHWNNALRLWRADPP